MVKQAVEGPNVSVLDNVHDKVKKNWKEEMCVQVLTKV